MVWVLLGLLRHNQICFNFHKEHLGFLMSLVVLKIYINEIIFHLSYLQDQFIYYVWFISKKEGTEPEIPFYIGVITQIKIYIWAINGPEHE